MSLLTVSFHLSCGRPLGRFPSIFISTTALMFSVSSLLLTWPNHSSLLLLITVAICSTFASSKISSFLRCSNRLTPIAHRTILISVVAIRLSSLIDIGHVSQPYSNVSRITCDTNEIEDPDIPDNHSAQPSPFWPCLCYSVLHVFAGSSSPVYRWSKIFEDMETEMVVSSVVCRCSVFALLTLSPFFSIHSLHLSSLTSIICLSGSHNNAL